MRSNLSQTTAHLLMVRPCHFRLNQQTSASNAFQKTPTKNAEKITALAIQEFDALASALSSNGITGNGNSGYSKTH
ncbi:MAG: arginine deiminase-related protein [Owenweeksia sp.]|nr:arginine deiminase-related protein [Owenweeksia sp.]